MIIKLTKHLEQIKLSIPKRFFKNSFAFEASYATIEKHGNSLFIIREVREYDFKQDEQR